MESKELLERMDEVKKRVPVSYQTARDALERNDYDVLEAVLELERTSGSGRSPFMAFEHQPKHAISLWRSGRDLVKVPAPLAMGAVLLAMKKPGLLAAALGAVIVSGTDIRLLKEGEKKFSLHETFFQRTGLSADELTDMRGSMVDKLDDRFHDIKERKEFGLFRDGNEPSGVKHFTIRL